MLNRRNFIKTATGLAALILSEVSSTQAQIQEQDPSDYKISYEDWKKAKQAYGEWNNEKDRTKKEQLKQTLENINLRARAKRISENEAIAYSTLSPKEKAELDQFYKSHREAVEFFESPIANRKQGGPAEQIGDSTGRLAIASFLLPLSIIMIPKRQAYLKEVYGIDIDLREKRPNLAKGMILYWDTKYTKIYDQEKVKKP